MRTTLSARRFARLASAALLVAGCSPSSPTPATPAATPSPPAVQITGTWSGLYQETACTSTCEYCCSGRWKSGAPHREFTLTVAQGGAGFTGYFAEKDSSAYYPTTGPVSGTVSAYQVHLSGLLGWRTQWPDLFGTSVIDAPALTLDAAGRLIVGKFVLTDFRADGREDMRRECTIMRLERTAP